MSSRSLGTPPWHTIPGDDRIETPRLCVNNAGGIERWHTIPGDDRIETR